MVILYMYSLQALKKLGHDKLILLLCFTVLLSYLPEAGEYSCFFVYLKLVSVTFISSVTFTCSQHFLVYFNTLFH